VGLGNSGYGYGDGCGEGELCVAHVDAWHIVPLSGYRYDSTLDAPHVGQVLEVDPDRLKLCSYGLHASMTVEDAAKFVPSGYLCRVRLSGRMLWQSDKICAERREILSMERYP
jgi:hypothetical protein